MKKSLLLLLSFLFAADALHGQGLVNFNNRVTAGLPALGGPVDAPITNLNGVRVSGTDYWAQLYAGEGLSVAEVDLAPVGVPANFRTGSLGGYVQVNGTNALGQAQPGSGTVVTSVKNGPASVQIRAWAAPFTSYEAARTGGGQYGESRILRMPRTGGILDPAYNLADSSGSVDGFALGGQPALSVSDTIVAEGTNGTVNATFSVTLLPPSADIVTVSYATADGTALAGEDYVTTTGLLTFLPGETNQSITVAVTGDAPAESDETFSVFLGDAINAFISRNQGTCTITEVQITGISVDTSVSFNTVLNHRYLLERTDDSTMANWSPVPGATNILGTGSIVTFVDKGAGTASGRFYRAKLIQ